jgi:FtsZ-interacting cell division protein ZipA
VIAAATGIKRQMDAFTLIVLGTIVFVVLVFLAIGFWHPARAMEITDHDRQERWATQADIEEHEVDEMVEGQNVYRRARGADELTAGDARRAASERQSESLERARAHHDEQDDV